LQTETHTRVSFLYQKLASMLYSFPVGNWIKTSLLKKQRRHKYDNEFRDATYPPWIMRDTRPRIPGPCES